MSSVCCLLSLLRRLLQQLPLPGKPRETVRISQAHKTSLQVLTSRHKSTCRAKAKERPWFPDVGRIGLPAMVPKSVSELSQTNPNMLKFSLLAKVETEMQ